MKSPRNWLNAKEAAEHYGISPRSFEDAVKNLGIPVYRPTGPKGDRRFWRDDLDAALLAQADKPAA